MALAKANAMGNPNSLKVGQVLHVPPADYVAVATRLGFTAAEVQRALEKALGRAWPTGKKKSGP